MTIQRSDIAVANLPFTVEDWGRTRYADAFERQLGRVDARRAGRIGDTLVFTEHEPVFTLGKRAGAGAHLLWTPEQCRAEGVEVFDSNRGGDITYHGPGQVVCYPILSLARRKDLHAYLRDLEEVVIRVLGAAGIDAGRRAGLTGIWTGGRKLCAIGVAVRSWVAYHGFALNLDPDLRHFSGIVPCGITDGTVTSVRAETGRPADPAAFKRSIAVEFGAVFSNAGWLDDGP